MLVIISPIKRTVQINNRNATIYEETINLFGQLEHIAKTGQKEKLENTVDTLISKAENLFAIEDFYREMEELDDIQETG